MRTTFITGFPGETDEDFAELLTFIKNVEFDRVGVFTYSDEEGTPAYDLPDKVEPKHRKAASHASDEGAGEDCETEAKALVGERFK